MHGLYVHAKDPAARPDDAVNLLRAGDKCAAAPFRERAATLQAAGCAMFFAMTNATGDDKIHP
jgi:hypothetical protein